MITKTETVYISGDEIEVDVELQLAIHDKSYSYSYGSINGVEKLEEIELVEVEVLSAVNEFGKEVELTSEQLKEVVKGCEKIANSDKYLKQLSI